MRGLYYGSILFFLTFMCFFTLFSVSDSLWNIFWSALPGYGVYRFSMLAVEEYKECKLRHKKSKGCIPIGQLADSTNKNPPA